MFSGTSVNDSTNFTKNLGLQKEENKNDKSKKNKIKKKCGRKRLPNNDYINEHNKYSGDNLRRKVKHLVIKSLFIFLNKLIKIVYKDNIGKGPLEKQLKTLNQSQISNSNVDYNKKFLSKTIKDIFSEDISRKFTNYSSKHNKLLINSLLIESNDFTKNYLNELFQLKFIDCLNHFCGKKYIDILNGLNCFKDIKEEILYKYEDGAEYCKNLEFYMNNFQDIINNKRGRKSKEK